VVSQLDILTKTTVIVLMFQRTIITTTRPTKYQPRFKMDRMAQVSYIELLSEHMRPEPRLRRLLGHVSMYENATRWQRQTVEKIELPFTRERERMTRDAAARAGNGQHGPLTTTVDESQPVQTFSEFQAMIRSSLENLPLYTVTETEMTEDSKESDRSSGSEESEGSEGSEESEGQDAEGWEHGDETLEEGEESEAFEVPPNPFLPGDGGDVTAEWPSWLIGKGEQINHPRSWGTIATVGSHQRK
jgi:hypothetical protein